MKGPAAVLLILSTVYLAQADTSPEFLNKISRILEPCAKENGVNKSDVMKLLGLKKLPETKEMKCTVDCYLVNAGYIKDGKFDGENGKPANKEKYDDPKLVAKADAVYEICAKTVNITGKEKCELSPIILKCLYDESIKINLPNPDFLNPDKKQ